MFDQLGVVVFRLLLIVRTHQAKAEAIAELSRRFAARVTFVAAKVTKTASRRTHADATHRCPALLAKQGTAPKLASLKQGASSALLCSGARRALTARSGKAKSHSKREAKAKAKAKAKAEMLLSTSSEPQRFLSKGNARLHQGAAALSCCS
ncbi:hypothetical protein [Pseudoxanthomonas sp. GM95]|uniref:hypothetical protein n=1 Tax=Pseudoxanthomonas sp. GM95 TaxID=1881043 RepID=UPI0015879FFE|nr:hypothetical protein [Pseudoxanthomonas sp. GM95]